MHAKFDQYVSTNMFYLWQIPRILWIFLVNCLWPIIFPIWTNNIFGQYVLDQIFQYVEGRFRAHNARAPINQANNPGTKTGETRKPEAAAYTALSGSSSATDTVPPALLYIHRTCATDTKQINFVFRATADFVLESSLQHVALFWSQCRKIRPSFQVRQQNLT